MGECLDGARRRDPPDAWQERLTRIAALRQRLARSSDSDDATPNR
jgi:hypothetical protein